MNASGSGDLDNLSYSAPALGLWAIIGIFILIIGVTLTAAVKITLLSVAPLGFFRYVATVFLIGIACGSAWFLVRLFLGAMSGLPRVTASTEEVKLTTAFGAEMWANWNSLTVFIESRVAGSRGGQAAAVAKIVGPNISQNLHGKHEFIITAGQLLRTSIPTLVHELNARRPIK